MRIAITESDKMAVRAATLIFMGVKDGVIFETDAMYQLGYANLDMDDLMCGMALLGAERHIPEDGSPIQWVMLDAYELTLYRPRNLKRSRSKK